MHPETQEEVSNANGNIVAMQDKVETEADAGVSTAKQDGSVGLGKESRQR